MKKVLLAVLVFGLVAGSALAASRDGRRMIVALSDTAVMAAADVAQQFVAAEGRRVLGLRQGEALRARGADHDGAGIAHVRFDTHVQGVRVFGGEVVVHVDAASNSILGITNQHRHVWAQDIVPALSEADAIGTAWSAMSPAAAPAVEPSTELVLYPKDGSYRLAWMVDAFMESGVEEAQARMFVIDAHSGEIIDSWDNLQTAKPVRGGGGPTPGSGTAAVGTANTLYIGTLSMATEYYLSSNNYGMVDRTRGTAYTTNMANSTSGSGTLFTNSINTWGNGTNADPNTAGTDAHLGMAFTWDYYKNVHGRNGIYNNGAGVYSRVHYGRSYNNAFWSDTCKCMTYGDGDGTTFTPLVALDVAGHEMSHGVTSATAKLQYSGESGGLNEATSDIFGECVEFFANSAKNPGDWHIGEMIMPGGGPLRYMDHPTLDGRSVDNYVNYTSGLDVHYSSGIANNFFYLLAVGGTNDTSKLSVTGIGRAAAERIWYVALTGYMTSTTNFAGARVATINAATQLYGATSTQVAAVKSAWTAVGVN